MNARYSPKPVRRPQGRPPKSQPLRCFGYARVSTIKQIEAPGGIKAQVDKIKRFCQMQGWQLLKVFKDEGVSALDERPAFNQLMKAIANKEADAVIVTRLDRLGRSVLD
ncbi:MAG: recombinase family protein, partial [Candidatus Methanomethylicaceae archaeon]